LDKKTDLQSLQEKNSNIQKGKKSRLSEVLNSKRNGR